MNEQDLIFVSGLVLWVKIGWSADERSFPQRLLMDIELGGIDLSNAARTGDLASTVCYATVKTVIKQVAEGSEWKLVEELAERTAATIFKTFAPVQRTRIKIHKFVVADTDAVGIEIDRLRPD